MGDTQSFGRVRAGMVLFCCALLLAGCGNRGAVTASGDAPEDNDSFLNRGDTRGVTLGEALRAGRNQEQIVQVNRYIWSASLQVLDFLPVQTVDPYTGVIVTGFGTPPGGGRAYRATVLISDPALDARSLNVALQTNGGAAASASTERAVEDAILTRARQLRIADNRF